MTISEDSVLRFLGRHGLRCDVEHRLLDVSSELGEVGKEVLKSSAYGRADVEVSAALAEEIGDLLFSVHALAVECGLDPWDQLAKALEKYDARHARRGDIGSDRDRP